MITDKRIQAGRTDKSGVKRSILSGLMLLSFLCISGVYANSDKKETFFNSEPTYRTVLITSFLKQPEKKQMENVRGLYYIVDAFGYTTADAERSGQYRALGSTVFVEETLLTEKTTEE